MIDELRWITNVLPKITKTETCWLWTGARSGDYGRVRTSSGPKEAHVIVYEYLVGPIPTGMELDHLCLVQHCVNPRHLEPVTPDENKRRMKNLFSECRYGHEYTVSNTYITPQGYRQCRTCNRKNALRSQKRRKATLNEE